MSGAMTTGTLAPTESGASSMEGQTEGGADTLKIVLNLMIILLMAIVMIGMGCAVEMERLKKHLKRPTGVIIGFIAQFGLMPLLAYLFSLIFSLEASISVALLIQASCPGGSTSNIAAYWMNGDMDLSLTMTSCSTILALGMMPLLLFIYSGTFDTELPVPYETIGITLASLLIPIVIGIFLRYKFPSKAQAILKVCSIGGVIVVVGVGVVSVVLFDGQWRLSGKTAAACVLLPLCGMILGYGLSSVTSCVPALHLTHKQRRTISMETGIQNTNLCGSVLLLAQFPPQDLGAMFLVPIIYVAAQLVFAILAVSAYLLYKKKFSSADDDEKDDKFESSEEKSSHSSDSKSTSFSAAWFHERGSTNKSFYHDTKIN